MALIQRGFRENLNQYFDIKRKIVTFIVSVENDDYNSCCFGVNL